TARGRLRAGERRREDGGAAPLAEPVSGSARLLQPRRPGAGRPGWQVTKRRVNPKSVNQRRYLDAIEKFDIVFGVGPAGTGKTYLAMAQAVQYLLSKKVSRVILARPAVEA